jgi:hypothetical protein
VIRHVAYICNYGINVVNNVMFTHIALILFFNQDYYDKKQVKVSQCYVTKCT